MDPGWSVYVLRCADGTLYTGITNNLERRLKAHNSGTGAAYTRARRPVTLLWSEPASGKSEALKRELYIKRLPRERKLELTGSGSVPDY